MTKYNKTISRVAATRVETHQGGTGFTQKPEIELMQLLASGITNTYYEKETEQDKRLENLIRQVGTKDPELVAKMLIYTRATIGQRSVTHRGAVALMPLISGRDWGKYFFTKRNRHKNEGGIVYRVDDMLEIAACYFALNPGKPLPNAMKKGFAEVFSQADAYELAKYRGEGKTVKLVDLVNLVHPTPNSKAQATLMKSLVYGDLKQFNTVEDKNTKSGQEVAAKVKEGTITEAEAKVELAKAKEDNFKELITEKNIGYLALLRNLRNIFANTTDKNLIAETIKNLTDEKAIRKSLVFPHQIDLALEVLLEERSVGNDVIKALNTAYELAIPNLSELGAVGRTAVVIDRSGSMTSKIYTGKGKLGRVGAIEKASLIGATLAKGLGADVYGFDYNCYAISYNPNDSINTIKNIFNKTPGGTTNFSSIFPGLTARYDRVFIISDMQGSDEIGRTMDDYKKKFNVDPYIYSINLCGYGNTMVKPGKKVFSMAGYTAEIYENIKKYEVNYEDVLKEVRKINFRPVYSSVENADIVVSAEKSKGTAKTTAKRKSTVKKAVKKVAKTSRKKSLATRK